MEQCHVTRKIAFAEIEEKYWIAIKEVGSLRHPLGIGIFGEHVEGETLRAKRVHALERCASKVLPIVVRFLQFDIEDRTRQQIIHHRNLALVRGEMSVGKILV